MVGTLSKVAHLGCRLKLNLSPGTRIVSSEEGAMGESIVFNSEQVEGPIDQYLVRGSSAQVDWQRAEQMVVTSGAKIKFVHGTYAAYHRPPQDFIVFPLKQQFIDGPGSLCGYYDSLFHELVHWSEPRLLWYPDMKWDDVTKYAINELRAEMGAGWMATMLDIPSSKMDRNHNKYLDRWLCAMRHDPGLIFQVAQGANLAVEYLLQIGHMSKATEVVGVVVEARVYGPLVVLYVEAGEGQIIPFPMNRLAFDEQMGAETSPVVSAVGRSVALDGGSVVILRGAVNDPD